MIGADRSISAAVAGQAMSIGLIVTLSTAVNMPSQPVDRG
jgi:hypothetical protein